MTLAAVYRSLHVDLNPYLIALSQAVQKANTVALSRKMASFKKSRFLDLLDSLF